jgi:predicted O-methyltransferase YrrM
LRSRLDVRGLVARSPAFERAARRNRLVIMARQLAAVRRYGVLRRDPRLAIRHVLTNRELVNFTYEIENEDELVETIASALDRPIAELNGYADELRSDRRLEGLLAARLRARPDRNNTAPYGRRLGWYLAVRATKPQLVVETGTHDGLGSTVILAALQRNAAGGDEGRLISMDIDPSAGWLVPEELRHWYELRIGDSLESLAGLGSTVDLAVLDSAHTYEHELAELELIAGRARAGTILISDNPGSRAFAAFCDRHRLHALEFKETPRRHVHPGGLLAISTFAKLP